MLVTSFVYCTTHRDGRPKDRTTASTGKGHLLKDRWRTRLTKEVDQLYKNIKWDLKVFFFALNNALLMVKV